MSKRYRIIATLLTLGLIITGFNITTWATTKKKITNINIDISGNIEVDTDMGEADIDVSTSSSTYSYSYYEVQNSGFKWSLDDVPEIKLYFTADDGYYFYITKASQITIEGATYKSAAREDSATTLVVIVDLPSLANQVYPVKSLQLSSEGVCSWEQAAGAGSYQVKFMRGSTILGGIQTVTGTTYNGSINMTKSGNYTFRVRPINNLDTSVTGAWVESNSIYISDAKAQEFRDNADLQQSAGNWMKDARGWWFVLPDSSYPVNSWRMISNEWYYFKSDGYMATGWQQIDGKWYYMDLESGAMWKNTTTPDGYNVSIDGSMYSK